MRTQHLILVPFLLLSLTLSAQDPGSLVGPFKGSAVVATYQARFSPLTLMAPPLDAKKNPAKFVVEGALESTLYTRPEGVSEFEVYSSYKKVLQAAGFDVILDCQSPDCNVKWATKANYGYPANEIIDRDYGKTPTSATSWLVGWTKHYLSAKKKTADKTYHVMILISTERAYYSVDVMESANMAEGSVELSPELLKAKMKDDGKAILHGIFFETGSDVITDASSATLDMIANYLRSVGGSYYVVGHTDDTGRTDTNVLLSEKRANAVVAGLVKRGIAASDLTGKGVGPYAPIGSNLSDPGKASNRRVELVARL